MKKTVAGLFFCILTISLFAGRVEKVFTFSQVRIVNNGIHQSVTLENTLQAGLNGEPMLPYHQVALMLPPGEKAVAIEIIGEDLTLVPGAYELYPQQLMQPLSKGPDGIFLKNEKLYSTNADYPANPAGNLINACLNGYSFALSTFTPLIYNPAKKLVRYYKKITVQITTEADETAALALKNLASSENILKRARLFAQNPEMISRYPVKASPESAYQILIITPSQFQLGFQNLINYYGSKGLVSQVATIESIGSMNGQDLPEKIRNYIIAEYQVNGIEQVILGGDVEHVPYRGLYCFVVSGSGYEDYNIPADIYYSALDGNWNANGDAKWGEPGEDDLLPEISVGRMSFSNAAELANMVHKSVSYQGNPVAGELNKPYLVSEFLYEPPATWGADYLELLVDEHDDNGYFTHGIPSAENTITRLYDAPGYNWSAGQLISGINSGQSFIHHCGHSNSNYMMRLYNWDITDQNFYQVDGVMHNYQLLYTHGCICGAFDDNDCIAEVSTSIANFLVGGVFNSRYGWFNQGTTEGPSAHIHREFISALYHPDPDSAMAELGSAHTMSKIKTAPWIGLPGEFEPGAQRWCQYDCNVLGDPALKVWLDNPVVGNTELKGRSQFTLSPNPCADKVKLTFSADEVSAIKFTLINSLGQLVLTRAVSAHAPVNQTLELDLSTLSTGVYYCRMESGTNSFVHKLMVIR